jgi:hypothetical protein
MNLPAVEKSIPSIPMNKDNQTMIIKVNSSKDNIKSSRHVKRRLKSVRKMRNSKVIALDYIPSRSLHKGSITKCDRKFIKGDVYETHNVSCPRCGNPLYVIGDPVK